MKPHRLAPAFFALLAATACSKTPPANAGLDEVHAALGSAGLKMEGFAAADARQCSATRCQAGRIDGIEALECEYGDLAAAQAGKKRCESWIGSAVTGVILERGRVILLLADRAQADPNGKAISKISQAFQETSKK